jgi:hypothetical protein
MSDWLERELARELAPVAAPGILGVRLGFAPATRREFPRVVLAVAAAVVLVMGGGYAAGRIAALDLRPLGARGLRATQAVEFASTRPVAIAAWLRRETQPPAEGVQLTGTRLLRCDGGAGVRVHVNAGRATALLAHAGSAVEGNPTFEAGGNARAAAPEAGCHLCHSL